MSEATRSPLKLFYWYVQEDKEQLTSLMKHLKSLQRQRLIDPWHHEEMLAGREWEKELEEQLKIAQIILLLVSADFTDSEYCFSDEMTRALQRHQAGVARVIPIILRHVEWELTPFGKLPALPTGAKPVKKWDDPDEAYTDIAKRLRDIVEKWHHAEKTEQGEEWSQQDEISNLKEDLQSLPVTIEPFTNALSISPQDIENYYEGKSLSWEIFRARADVVRDQQEDLVEAYLQPIQKTRMLCLCGEPGAGKSTLAWRIALEITQRSKQLLIQIDNNETSDVWRQLSTILARYPSLPCVILVDDVFRSDEAKRALLQLKRNLMVTIIATSQSNEITAKERRESFVTSVEVQTPSPGEKKRVMEKLQKGSLSEEQMERLTQANHWVVMMMELTSGKELKTIVQNSISRLEANPRVYRAYKYLSYTGIYQLPIPATLLLDAADARGHLLKDDQAGQSLIFYSDKSDHYSTLHPVFARAAFEAYLEDASSVLIELIEKVQLSQRSHRVFLCTLFYRSMKEQAPLVTDLLVQKADKIIAIFHASTHSELWYYWRGLSTQVGDTKQIALIEELMITKTPHVSLDWIAYCKFLKEKASPDYNAQAIDVAKNWFQEHVRDQDACVGFLGAVDRWGSEDLWTELLKDIQKRLTIPDQADALIRAAYLALVGKRGREGDWNEAIERTASWLKMHKEDALVRSAYLALVGKRGKEEHWNTAIKNTARWLRTHKEDLKKDALVRSAYLSLVGKRGQEGHCTTAIEDTTAWLEAHPNESDVRKPYLALVGSRGQAEHVHRALEDTAHWLSTDKENSQGKEGVLIRAAYLTLVEKRGQEGHCTTAIEDTTAWLEAHPNESDVRRPYLVLVERRGKEQHWQRVLEGTARWLKDRPDENTLWQPYLALVDSRGQENHWNSAFEYITPWLRDHPKESNLRKLYLVLVGSRGKEDQWKIALEDTASWLKSHPDEISVYTTYLELAERHGTQEHGTIAMKDAAAWLRLRDNKDDFQVRPAYLRILAKWGTSEQRMEAMRETTRWIEAHSKDTSSVIQAYFMLTGEEIYECSKHVQIIYLNMVGKYSKKEYCKHVLEKTSQWLKAHHEIDVSVYEAYLRLVERRGEEVYCSSVIEELGTWLQTHEADAKVWVAFLRLVEKRGQEKLWNEVIVETGKWLQTQQDGSQVRAPFLGFVERCGKENHWYTVIAETREWLQTQQDGSQVRAPFLGFVKRCGKENHWYTVIAETREWLQTQQDGSQVRVPYLKLVERRGKEEHVDNVIEETRIWLQTQPQDSYKVSPHYLGLVARHGTDEQLVTAYQMAKDWLTHQTTPDFYLIQHGYGKILLTLKRYEEAEKQFLHVLDKRKSFVAAHIDLAWSYYYQGKKDEAAKELLNSQTLVNSGDEYPAAGVCLNLGRYWMLENKVDTALKWFQKAIGKDPTFYQCHMEAGRAYLALKKYSQALQALQRAKDLLPSNISLQISQEIDKDIAAMLHHPKKPRPPIKQKRRKLHRENTVQAMKRVQ